MDKIRIWLAAALIAAMGTGFCAGTRLPRGESQIDTNIPTASAFEGTDAINQFRTERQALRQMQLSQLNEIVHGEDQEIAALARRRQLELMEWAEQELTLEGTLSLRGFEDVLVTVHTDSVNVMVRAQALNQSQAAVILEAVTRETGISGGNVKIIPIN